MCNILHMISDEKWITVRILKALKEQIDDFCDNETNGFANPSQYIHHALKNDLDWRLKNAS